MYQIKFYLKNGIILEQTCKEYEFEITPITKSFVSYRLSEVQGEQLKYLNFDDVSAITVEKI